MFVTSEQFSVIPCQRQILSATTDQCPLVSATASQSQLPIASGYLLVKALRLKTKMQPKVKMLMRKPIKLKKIFIFHK